MKKLLLPLFLLLLFSGLLLANSFVGPEKCLTCHNNSSLGDATGWRTSMHANGYSVVLDDAESMQILTGIVNDYDQNGIDDFHDGLDFNTISSVFDAYKPNAPVLAYSASNGYTITIGQMTHKVYLTYGGSGLYKQRYGVKINTAEGETQGIYISPIQFNEKTHEYVLYHVDAWYDNNNAPVYTSTSTLAEAATNSRSLAKGCAGCHVTGLTLDQNASGEWIAHGAGIDPATENSYGNNVFDLDGDGSLEQINVGCERCHGEGGDHAASGDKTKIINPADLTTAESNNLCGMCHSRGKSLPNQTFSFPYHDDTMTSWTTGETVSDIYTDGGGYWPDEIHSKQHHQQFYDFYESTKPTFAFHKVRCTECHDVHNNAKHHMVESIEEEDANNNPLTIATDNDNNTLCLACHATHGDFEGISKEMVADYAANIDAIGAVVQGHTKHPYDPENSGASRCSKCHMPKIVKSAISYDIHSHTFETISPQNTLDYQAQAGMPNTCATCHKNNSYGEGVKDTLLATWNNPEDVQIAEWGKLYFDMFTSDKKGGVLEAKKTSQPPVLDGLINDPAWATAPTDTVFMVVKGVHESAMSVEMKAVYDNNDLYIMARWADPTMTVRRQEIEFDGSQWVTTGETDAVREDRIGIFWPMTSIKDFDSRGCMATCHNTRERWGKFLGPDEYGDMWHSKGARTWPAGYVDDKYVTYDTTKTEDGGRHGDASGSTFCYYNNLSGGVPQWMGATHDANPSALYDNTYTSLPWPGSWAVAGKAYDPNAGWQAGDRLPKYVMKVPDSGSDRADIRIAPVWDNGYWTVEIKRALDTGHPEHDVIFSDLSKEYKFAVATIDNGTQPANSGIYPNLHAHQGVNYERLHFEDYVGISGGEPTAIAAEYELQQNYPNPFNPTTTIKFKLAKAGNVNLYVYNVLGQKVKTLVDESMFAGEHSVRFDASGLASGLYFYRLETNSFSQIKKMLLVK